MEIGQQGRDGRCCHDRGAAASFGSRKAVRSLGKCGRGKDYDASRYDGPCSEIACRFDACDHDRASLLAGECCFRDNRCSQQLPDHGHPELLAHHVRRIRGEQREIGRDDDRRRGRVEGAALQSKCGSTGCVHGRRSRRKDRHGYRRSLWFASSRPLCERLSDHNYADHNCGSCPRGSDKLSNDIGSKLSTRELSVDHTFELSSNDHGDGSCDQPNCQDNRARSNKLGGSIRVESKFAFTR